MNLSDDAYIISGDQRKIVRQVDSGLFSTVARLRSLGGWWVQKRSRARQLRELHRFSDRELWDVGLSRSDIQAIERGTYSRD